jgi:hypothetical protein
VITLATLHLATAQAVYNQARDHLLAQGKKAFNNDGLCSYRTDEGLRCAAGCFIAPEEYSLEFEGNPWRTLVTEEKVPKDHCALISQLQRVHDSEQVEDWPAKLAKVATKFGLTP